MTVTTPGDAYRYDVQSLCQIFFPRESFKKTDFADKLLTVSITAEGACAQFVYEGKSFSAFVALSENPFDKERAAVKKAVYTVLTSALNRTSPWGSLTGIRPALFYKKVRELYGENADDVMKTMFSVSDKKLSLCARVLEGRAHAEEINTEDSASLYISIPFCPSRCAYCSFVSALTDRDRKLVPSYLDALLSEAQTLSDKVISDGKRLRAIYIGGGTPSVLTEQECEKLLTAVERLFLSKHPVEEFTFEAGRPDTVTDGKLRVLAAHGVTRISINPQTLSQSVLDAVARKHTVKQFFDAYEMAARFPFDKNVDLIAGLPTDTEEGFTASVDGITELKPECLTVHTLYLKRAADFGQSGKAAELAAEADDKRIAYMLNYAYEHITGNAYRPYYLYRQKNTMGNGENVGYALSGHECLYNVWMMDDIQQIYGLGAGAVTKYLDKEGIRRDGSTKLPLEYLKNR